METCCLVRLTYTSYIIKTRGRWICLFQQTKWLWQKVLGTWTEQDRYFLEVEHIWQRSRREKKKHPSGGQTVFALHDDRTNWEKTDRLKKVAGDGWNFTHLQMEAPSQTSSCAPPTPPIHIQDEIIPLTPALFYHPFLFILLSFSLAESLNGMNKVPNLSIFPSIGTSSLYWHAWIQLGSGSKPIIRTAGLTSFHLLHCRVTAVTAGSAAGKSNNPVPFHFLTFIIVVLKHSWFIKVNGQLCLFLLLLLISGLFFSREVNLTWSDTWLHCTPNR